MGETLKGYKVFNPEWTCKEHKFEIGKTYKHIGDIVHCRSGFHFCLNLADCFNYYAFDSSNKVAEVEALDKWITNGDKTVCNKIKIIKELTWEECLRLCNTGKDNSGDWNSGDWNSGYRNSGDSNSGDWNSGYSNSGDWNSGYRNSGNSNSGDWNSGYSNSGHRNSGHRNSGDWNSGHRNSGNLNSGNSNSGHRNSGDWNTNEPYMRIFNKSTKLYRNAYNQKYSRVLDIIQQYWYNNFNVWVYENAMTDKEKEDNPSHKTTGGYLRKCNYQDCWKMLWDNITKEQRKLFTKLPNFRWSLFTKITGIKRERL